MPDAIKAENSAVTTFSGTGIPAPCPYHERGLFIIGAARSGTTILQNALNDSRDIFLFGEPKFHSDLGTPDFAARYNSMHRSLGNQENKSTFCPMFFVEDAPWHEYLAHCAGLYRYVGCKIAVNPQSAAFDSRQLFDFQSRYFYRSRYIFTFRSPIEVCISTRGLAEYTGGVAASYEQVLHSFLTVMGLYLRMLRNFPWVSVLFHEETGVDSFTMLGKWLDLDLTTAASYYDETRVRHYSLDAIPAPHQERVSAVVALYEEFRAHSHLGFERVQLDQNSNHFEQRHFTPLGDLARRIDAMLISLAPKG